MNRKVKLIAATMAVGMAATLTGCGGCLGCNGCAGCGGDTGSHTLTRSNWFTGTSYNGIQPSFIEGHEKFSAEKITYDVTFDDTDANNANYALSYDKGVFETEFYGTEYDWSDPAIPEGYAPENGGKEIVYCYKTTLTISGQYEMKVGKGTKEFSDHMETVSYFRAAGNNLKPVYSKQIVQSTSPANYQPVSLKDAYKEINVTYENFYNYSASKVKVFTTEDGKTEEKVHNLGKVSNTLFDNSSLYIVARSLKLSSSLSQPVSLFSAAAGGADEYAIVGSGSSLTADERASFTTKLIDKGLYESKGEDDKGVESVAVTVSFAGGDLHGTSQTIWYAAISDADNNVSRTTMLKLSIPISYNLGTLNFSLNEIKSTLWNG